MENGSVKIMSLELYTAVLVVARVTGLQIVVFIAIVKMISVVGAGKTSMKKFNAKNTNAKI